MNEKRFVLCKKGDVEYIEDNGCVQLYGFDVLCEMLNEQQATICKLQEEKEYWESKAMTLLLQVSRLTSRMTDKEVKEFEKELFDDE